MVGLIIKIGRDQLRIDLPSNRPGPLFKPLLETAPLLPWFVFVQSADLCTFVFSLVRILCGVTVARTNEIYRVQRRRFLLLPVENYSGRSVRQAIFYGSMDLGKDESGNQFLEVEIRSSYFMGTHLARSVKLRFVSAPKYDTYLSTLSLLVWASRISAF